MVIEHAGTHAVPKPWGSADLRPWSNAHQSGVAIGELWFEREDPAAVTPALLLKLLFTEERLSIQVHPDDAYARSMGLPHGKTEAWYILSARPNARIAVGLKEQLTPDELRIAVTDGSIERLIAWRKAEKGDVVVIPAGTIHAIGPGLVLAEIQQRSDTTFRLFDYGRGRPLDIEDAVAVADAGPYVPPPATSRITSARNLLATTPSFVLEKIELLPKSQSELKIDQETWVLVIDGHARIGGTNAFAGQAFFADGASLEIKAGSVGVTVLVSYTGPNVATNLLETHGWTDPASNRHPPLREPVTSRAANFNEIRP